MFDRTVSEIVKVTGGHAENINLNEKITVFVSNDIETVKNCCYVSINGQKHKGNEFAGSAIKRGASLIMTEETPGNGLPAVIVGNSVKSLCDVAAYYRQKELSYVIAVTGSVGKTTTKELCYNILSQSRTVHKTVGNKNSVIGLPLSVLGNTDCDTAVLEAGISEKGEMTELSRVAKPDVAVVTSVSAAHTETLGDLDNIAKEKLKITEYMPKGGKVILPAGNPLLKDYYGGALTVSLCGCESDYSATDIRFDKNGSYFSLMKKGRKVIDNLFVPIIGKHACFDAVAAIAACDLSGSSEKDIREGLALYKSDGIRQNITVIDGVTVIEDFYNMSPLSASSALEAFRQISEIYGKKKRIVMFGDMLELGSVSKELHRELGIKVVLAGADVLITIGENSYYISDEAKKSGMKEDCVHHFWPCERAEAGKLLGNISDGDSLVLIKGSRGMRMEEFPDYLKKVDNCGKTYNNG